MSRTPPLEIPSSVSKETWIVVVPVATVELCSTGCCLVEDCLLEIGVGGLGEAWWLEVLFDWFQWLWPSRSSKEDCLRGRTILFPDIVETEGRFDGGIALTVWYRI